MPLIAQDALIGLGNTDALGDFLVGPEGMTLYMYPRDPLGESVCVDTCLERWPALLVDSADDITVVDGVPGEFSAVERPDGTMQVAYNGMPLYYFQRDEAVGDTNGQGVGKVWWVVPPATVYAFRHGDAPAVLVGPTGMTLYLFTNDEPGVSNCYDQCAENWPPLLVDSADGFVPGVLLSGEFGTTERTDGTLQVTYNDWPLYYFAGDEARGDTNGEGRGDVWFTIAPETVAVGSTDELGDFLVNYEGLTLYLFTNDEPGVSNCAEECAENWPPFTVQATDPLVAGNGVMGELGTIERADNGRFQVTYNGMPLYFWNEDAAPGDTNGQGLGDVWFVVEP
jgi:predicted lipoprotein with Yx(FWY)xxD motif